jgi:hypothetical protein
MASMWDDWMKQAGGGLATSLGPKALGAIGMVPESAQGSVAFGLLPALLGPSALFGAAAPVMMGQSMQGSAAPTAAPAPAQRPDMPESLYGGLMPPANMAPAPSVREGFMQRLLGGSNYQQSNMPGAMGLLG